MKVTSQMLFRIAAMPEQAMVAAITFLAEQLEADEGVRSANAERQARYRERHRDVTVTQQSRNDDVSEALRPSRVEDNILKLTSRDTPRNKTPTPPSPPSSKTDPEGFEEFWEIYPKRDGTRDRVGAVKAFRAALKRAKPQNILDGAAAYARAMEARGKINTEFVLQARTWLNKDLWNERYDGAAEGGKAASAAILERYAAPARS